MFEALSLNLKDKKSKVSWYDLVGKKEARKIIQKSLKDGRGILKVN